MEQISQGPTDLGTLAGVMGWAKRSSDKVGSERVETILDMYEASGYMTRGLKDAVLGLMRLGPPTVVNHDVSLADSMAVLLQLNSLALDHSKGEGAVLELLISGRDKQSG
jgi:hypothetical protein